MSIHSIAALLEPVRAAGHMALEAQSRLDFADRELKPDGSILTEADVQVESYLLDQLSRLYPQANLLGEESEADFCPGRWTLAIDPIDGTDAFSQGMPGWCVSVGLLDPQLEPVAGVVYAPRWGSLLFADLGRPVTHNGRPLARPVVGESLSPQDNLFVHSSAHRRFDLGGYPGKVRGVGSAALHFCFPLLYQAVIGALSSPVYIWDMAGAHAINRSLGCELRFFDGGEIDYAGLVGGELSRDAILSGPPRSIALLRACLRRR
ncbi:MAG: inositol monophosphatase [Chloroflexia bacterium]|nr:inositol monophosphatase [Chloroflexia bacterium]